MQIRLSPSGQFLIGATPGDVPTWTGSEWVPAPGGGGPAAAQPYIDTFTAPGVPVPGDGTETVVFPLTPYIGNTSRQLVDFVAYGIVGGGAPGAGPAQLMLTAYIDGFPHIVNAGFGYWISPPFPAPPGIVSVFVGASLRTLSLGVGLHTYELRGQYYDPAGGGGAAFWEPRERSILIQDIGHP